MTPPSSHDRCPDCGAVSRYFSPHHARTCGWWIDPLLALTEAS